MTEAEVVKLHSEVPEADIKPVSRPGHVWPHHLRVGVGENVIIGLHVRHDLGALFSEHLAPGGVVPVIVRVEEILDRSLGDPPDLCQHGLRVLPVHGIEHHDAVPGHHEHRDVLAIGCEAVDARTDLLRLGLGRGASLLSLDNIVAHCQ